MFNKENAIDASKLHVDSFKYQSTEDMPNEIYEEWQERLKKESDNDIE